MIQAQISEIFQSIQGEGPYVGTRQVFVRFYGCNIRCAWCDTPEAIGEPPGNFEEYTIDELWRKVSGLWEGCHSISLTGGEPLLQKDFIQMLLPRMKSAWVTSYLETNGIFYNELADIIEDVDIIAMDLKLPSSTQCRPFWNEHEEFLRIARRKEVFIKTVISGDTEREDILRSVDLVAAIDPGIMYILQPNSSDDQRRVIQKCLEYQKDCLQKLKNVRIIPQVHKFLKLR
ncbi:MAG TPA: 7-carboxy-7-deazaguanine synthase QueE [Candidatus Omnitrophota bacterium]|nr:7-carboxy-7-deazaguanine synthase QueE [Candidatus Omnitrophota bacterium]